MVLDVAGDVAGLHRRRRLIPKRLFDRLRDQRPVLDDLPPLVRMLREELAHPTDQPGGRLVAGAGQQCAVDEDLGTGEATPGAGLVFELRHEQLGHEVVGRVLGPPVDVLAELAVGEVRVRSGERGAVVRDLQVGVEPVADDLLVLLGDTEEHPDRAHRHLGAEVGDEVESPGADQRVQ